MQSNRISALDGWRALSVGLVIVDHLIHFSSMRTPDFGRLADVGGLGVSLFFGISGFVIARGLVHERAATGSISLSAFYIRRSGRILPPLVLYCAAVTLLMLAGVLPADPGFARALSFTCNLPIGACPFLAAHTWSLAVEEQFYIVAPLTLAALLPRRSLLCGVVLSVLPACVLLLALDLQTTARVLMNFTVICCGVACGVTENRWRGWSVPLWLPLVALLCAVMLYFVPNQPIYTAMRILGLGPAIMLTLLGSALNPVTRKLLSWPPLVATGTVSYGIYLWQQLAVYPFPGAGPLFYAGSVALCVAVSFASYHLVERRLISRAGALSKQAKARQSRLAQSASPAG